MSVLYAVILHEARCFMFKPSVYNSPVYCNLVVIDQRIIYLLLRVINLI